MAVAAVIVFRPPYWVDWVSRKVQLENVYSFVMLSMSVTSRHGARAVHHTALVLVLYIHTYIHARWPRLYVFLPSLQRWDPLYRNIAAFRSNSVSFASKARIQPTALSSASQWHYCHGGHSVSWRPPGAPFARLQLTASRSGSRPAIQLTTGDWTAVFPKWEHIIDTMMETGEK